MDINESVLNIYRENWNGLRSSLGLLSTDKYTNPFLLAFDEEQLKSSDMRVMIFGQETKGWGDRFGIIDNPKDVIAMYDRFFCQKKFYGGYGKSSFWKAFRYFEKKIQASFTDKKIYFSWNNINKVGKSKGKTGVNSEVRDIERENFSVIFSEVEAFKPDIVIFLTGPSRDSDILHHFKDAVFSSVTSDIKTRALAKVKSKSLPKQTIRMYHPTYFGGFNKVREHAVEEITVAS